AFRRMLDRLRALPGIYSASQSDSTPLGGMVDAAYLQIDGYTAPHNEHELVVMNEVSDRYFETLSTRFLAGRDFNTHDTPGAPKVAIVNESFSRKYLHGKNPVGRRYRPEHGNKTGDPVEIIGLVRDTKYLDLREEFRPAVYIAARQDPNPGNTVTFELRASAGKAMALREQAKHAVAAVDSDASLEFRTLAGQVEESLARERLLATRSGFFGALAILLAMV